MRSWNVTTRLLALLLLLGALVAALLAAALLALERSAATVDSVYRDRVLPLQQLRAIADAWRDEVAPTLQARREGRVDAAAAGQRIDAAQASVDRHWKAYLGTVLVDRERELIERIGPLLRDAEALLERARALLPAPADPALERLVVHELPAALQPLLAALHELEAVQVDVAGDAVAQAQRLRRNGVLVLALLAAAAVVGAGLLAAAVVARHQQEQRAADARTERMVRFFRALSRTNHLIVRERDAGRLFDELVRTCVDVGGVRYACVYRLGDEALDRVASAGVTPPGAAGTLLQLRLDDPLYERSAIGRAVRSGEPEVVNRYLEDPRQQPWHQAMRESGVQAVAALPLRRGGAVCGALMLYAAEPDVFDAELQRLLVEMAGDISFALDQIDREAAQRQARSDAEAALDRFRRVFFSAPVPAFIVSQHEVVVREVNDVAVERYGLTREVMLGHRLREFGLGIVDEDRDRFFGALRQRGRVEGVPLRLRAAGGRIRDALLSGEALDYGGEPCFLIMSLDVTEQRRAEQALRTLNAELEQRVQARTAELSALADELAAARDRAEAATRAKSEFLANMSHEIRTPMNAIVGLSRLAARTPANAQQADYLAKCALAADSLLMLIDGVLDFSKIEAGRLDLEHAPFALAAVLERVQAIVAPRAQAKGLALQLDAAPAGTEALLGDAQRLQQVLVNLAGNAVKFTHAGRVELRLRAEPAPGSGLRLHVAVRDTGIGIDAEQLDRLFQPFVQADASTTRRFGGTGLGLAISRQLVRLMGGEIVASSRAGEGSEFGFSLTFQLADATAVPQEAVADGQPPLRSLRGRRVLLVEDNELNQLVASELLREEAGVAVEVAGNGDEALRRLAQGGIDAVLMDLQMPGMDGLETTRRLRADARTAALPVVAMTANASVADREACRAAGMDDYLTKPVDPPRLFQVLARVLAGTGQPAAPAVADLPASAEATEHAGLRVADGLARCLGRAELYQRILERFIETRAELPAEIGRALSCGDSRQAALLSHSLVSTAGTIGAAALSALARELQAAIDRDGAGPAARLLPALAREHAAVTAQVRQYLAARA